MLIDFNGPDVSPLPSPWVTDSVIGAGLSRISNAASVSSVADHLSYVPSSTTRDVSWTIVGSASVDGGGAICLDSAGNGYMVSTGFSGGIGGVFRIDAGSFTFLDLLFTSPAIGRRYRFYRQPATPNVLALDEDGSPYWSMTETTYMTGFNGLYMYDSGGGGLDDWDDGASVGGDPVRSLIGGKLLRGGMLSRGLT